ncbi:MAG: ABC transporter permease [Acidobacteriia bacterium]|nr:ABC transporter permease [Terriglobia bacterium]
MSFLHSLFKRSQEDRELDEELRFHVAAEAQMRIDRGERPDSAWRAARRDFGNATLTREVTRNMWGWMVLERAAQDVRFGARLLRKNLAFTGVALAALVLGIGATTAIFSVVNSVLLKPLTFLDPGRLVMVWESAPSGKTDNLVQTQNFLDWRQRNRSFAAIAAMEALPANLSGDNDPVQVPGLRVSADFFRILGVPALLGRTMRQDDDVYGASCVVVLSHGIWQRRFGSQPDVIGRRIRAGETCEVIGVMPPGFEFPTLRADIYVPIRINPADAPLDGRNYRTVARLRNNVSLGDARADMRAIALGTARERPAMNTGMGTTVISLMEQTVGDTRAILLVLLGAVGFLLLIACANVANLLLMRASSRRREMNVRVALGAGRWRLLHQLTVESLLLAAVGGLLGFALAYWGVPAIIRMLPAGFPLPRMQEIAVDRAVLAFTVLISLGCGVFFGLLPALQVDRARVSAGLHHGGRTGTAGNRLLRSSLVVTEIAVAVLLVIGAGLMLRSFILLNETNPGFRPERLIAFRMLLMTPLDEHWMEHRAAVVQQILERVRALPMVAAASSIHLIPLGGVQSGSSYYRTDRPAPPPGSNTGGDVSVISDGYFRTMGIPLVAGREFEGRDRMGAPDVAIVNQTEAEEIYPGENPLGKHLKVSWNRIPEVEIVGVAADVRHHGLEKTPLPCLFLPQAQAPSGFASVVVRTSGDPAAAIAAVKEQMRAVAPNQGIQDINTMEQLISGSMARPKLQMTLMSIFGAIALALACLGVYAVVSYSVEQRTREMGIRVALGAAPTSILRLVLGEGVSLASAGIAAGLLAALALTRYLATLLYTVRPTDPLVYGAVSALLGAAAVAGCYFPAHRATRVDPAVVLREE